MKAVPAAKGLHTYIHISFREKPRTCEKDDAPYLADINPSKYRARFVIFEEKPFLAHYSLFHKISEGTSDNPLYPVFN